MDWEMFEEVREDPNNVLWKLSSSSSRVSDSRSELPSQKTASMRAAIKGAGLRRAPPRTAYSLGVGDGSIQASAYTQSISTITSTSTLTMASEDILLFGLGGVGAVYAYILSRAQNVRVTVAARSNYKVVKEQGLEIQSEKYGNTSGYKFHNGALAVPFKPERARLPFW